MPTYHIITYGCQMNKSDSERIAFKLEQKNLKATEDVQQANLVVINVCSVREAALDRAKVRAKQIKSLNPKAKLILTGCLLDKDKNELKQVADGIWPQVGLESAPKHHFKNSAFVPIMTGCNNYCSYCVVPYTRGREKSRRSENILKDIRRLVKAGHKEITLLGQNVNSYFSDFKIKSSNLKTTTQDRKRQINFPKLLKEMVGIPGDFKISFLTSHPKDMSDELIDIIAQSSKISKNIHLPVQSGDNEILKKMNRKYAVGHYKRLIKKIRNKVPEAKVSTDIIVGFPTETRKQFNNTLKLIKEIDFSQIFVAVYSPRPQTAALKLKDNVSPEEKKRRREEVLRLVTRSE